jgi:hypothetical protein
MKNLIEQIRRWYSRLRRQRRERAIIKKCHCICYCPNCQDPLNDQATWVNLHPPGYGRYKCRKCGNPSIWDFEAAPVPILVSPCALENKK